MIWNTKRFGPNFVKGRIDEISGPEKSSTDFIFEDLEEGIETMMNTNPQHKAGG